MKKTHLLCGAVCALLSASPIFISCDKSDEGDDSFHEVEKMAISGSSNIRYLNTSNDVFAYDDKGRLVKSISSGYIVDNPTTDTTHISFTDSTFTGESVYFNQVPFNNTEIIYRKTLSGKLNKQGYITFSKATNDSTNTSVTVEYKYDSLGQLISETETSETGIKENTIKWEDGCIVASSNGEETITYTYKKEPAYKNLGKIQSLYCPNAAYGVSTAYLPVSITKSKGGNVETYEIKYTFDADGYPLSIEYGDIYRTISWK